MTAVLDRSSAMPGRTGGAAPPALPSAPARTRIPVLLLGLLIVLGSGIGFALWSTDLDERESVLVAARPIAAGAVIAPDDFRVAELGGADGVASIPGADASLFVGSTAVDDIAEGAVVNRFQFAADALIEPGEAIVGVVLDPGANPVPTLRPGDVVEVVAARGDGTADVVAVAKVFAVRATSDLSSTVSVSLVVPHGDVSTAVVAAAGDGGVRLVLLAEG